MSVERWIFHEGMRLGNSKTIDEYLDVLAQRVLQVMPRAELIMFYTNLQLMGGYMAVQAKKRWQQVVKNCNFAQTTSSSYSTRNKYESYLLAKEEHDFLMAITGQSESMSPSRGMAALAEVSLCHFEQVEGQSSKKNLLAPLLEMLRHSPEAIDAILGFLVKPDVTPEEISSTLLVLRGLISKKHQEMLGPHAAKMAGLDEAVVSFCARYRGDGAKSDEMVLAATVVAIGCMYREAPLPAGPQLEAMAAMFMDVMENSVPLVFTGRTLVNRLRHAPPWLLRALPLQRLVDVTVRHIESCGKEGMTRLPLCFIRLLSSAFRHADGGGQARELDAEWETILTNLLSYATYEFPIEGPLRAMLASFCIYRPIYTSWICENLGVGTLAEVEKDEEDNSSEERKNAEGRRRAVTLSRKKPTQIKLEMKRPRGESGGESESASQEYDLKNETEDQRIRRIKRDKERDRRERMKEEKEERDRLAAERREKAAELAPKRPRKPVQKEAPTLPERRTGSSAVPPMMVDSTGSAAMGAPAPAKRLRGQTHQPQTVAGPAVSGMLAQRLQLQNYALQAQVEERDVLIASLGTTVSILEGNMRFWNGLSLRYTDKEKALVRANAQAVLQRLEKEDAEQSVELHQCVLCKEAPGENATTCAILSFCLTFLFF